MREGKCDIFLHLMRRAHKLGTLLFPQVLSPYTCIYVYLVVLDFYIQHYKNGSVVVHDPRQ